MTNKNIYVKTRISEKDKDRIEAICEEENWTLSEFVRLAIKEKLAAMKKGD